MTIWVGILAAGLGSRMGKFPKALLEWNGLTFIEAIAQSAREGGVTGIAVVLGYHAEDVQPVARRLAERIVVNPLPSRGMSSSAALVASALPLNASMLLWPVDYPAILSSTVASLMRAGTEKPNRVVIPSTPGSSRGGHPPLLPARVVAALRDLKPTERLDRAIAAAGGDPVLLEVNDPAIDLDVDQPADLEKLRRSMSVAKQKVT